MNKDAQGRWKVGMSNIKLKMRDYTRSLRALIRERDWPVFDLFPSFDV